jgi:hypothetical protein
MGQPPVTGAALALAETEDLEADFEAEAEAAEALELVPEACDCVDETKVLEITTFSASEAGALRVVPCEATRLAI